MEMVIIQHADKQYAFTIDEARVIAEDLRLALNKHDAGIRSRNTYGSAFLTRNDFNVILGRIYPDAHKLRIHAGRLFANIVKLARFSESEMHPGVGFNVLCNICNRHVSQSCTESKGWSHLYTTTNHQFRVEAASLANNLEAFCNGTWHTVGKGNRDDLRYIVSAIS